MLPIDPQQPFLGYGEEVTLLDPVVATNCSPPAQPSISNLEAIRAHRQQWRTCLDRPLLVDGRCSGVANQRHIADGQAAVANVRFGEGRSKHRISAMCLLESYKATVQLRRVSTKVFQVQCVTDCHHHCPPAGPCQKNFRNHPSDPTTCRHLSLTGNRCRPWGGVGCVDCGGWFGKFSLLGKACWLPRLLFVNPVTGMEKTVDRLRSASGSSELPTG